MVGNWLVINVVWILHNLRCAFITRSVFLLFNYGPTSGISALRAECGLSNFVWRWWMMYLWNVISEPWNFIYMLLCFVFVTLLNMLCVCCCVLCAWRETFFFVPFIWLQSANMDKRRNEVKQLASFWWAWWDVEDTPSSRTHVLIYINHVPFCFLL